jgi:catechol 2,3-dioxygenase-like lactoylglutathione lyase family enzyme
MLGGFPIVATVPVTDLGQAKSFYSDVLGLKLDGEEDGESLYYEGANGTMLEVYRTRAGVGSGHTEAGFIVTEIETLVAGLREKGVTFEDYDFGDGLSTVDGILHAGDSKLAWFPDPEGNLIGLFQQAG